MIRALSRTLTTFLALALVAGCATAGHDYPSLAPRAAEKMGFAEPEIAQPTVAPDPALDAQIAAKRAALAKLAKGFDGDADHARALAKKAAGSAVGSDAWLDAQLELGTLDDWRAQTSSLIEEVDTTIADRAARLAPVYDPLATLRDEAVADATRQNDAIQAISATIPAA